MKFDLERMPLNKLDLLCHTDAYITIVTKA